MADMIHVMREGHANPRMVQLTGGVERLETINPQAGPEVPCPPVPCPPVDPNAPMGPAINVHEPAPGQQIVVNVVPNQPLIFDFNPLDLKATQSDGDLILTFPDGAQIVLHQLVGPCGPQPTPFELPDGTVITPSELLHDFNLEAIGPCGLGQINPAAGPTPIFSANTGFAAAPYQVGGIGPGIVPLGPLPPTGFGIGAEFLKGVGGGFPTPPGTPGPAPPPPPGHFLTVPDLDVHNYFLGTTAPAPANVGGTSYTVTETGNYITEVVSSSPAASITDYWTPGTPPPAFGTHASPSTPLAGQFGTFTMNAAGNYSYVLSSASEHTLSQLGTDFLSQSVNAPFNSFQPGFQDVFDVATTNGFDSAGNAISDIKQIQFDFCSANVSSTAASIGAATPAVSTTDLLLTYTDIVDPSHSFQQLVHVAAGGAITVTPESTTTVQPNDPALVSLEYLAGAAVTIASITIEGETLNTSAVTLNTTSAHAVAGVINPMLDGLGDPGDTGSVSAAGASQDSGATLVTTHPFNDAVLSGVSGTFGYLYDTGVTATGASNADIINYAGGAASNITLTGSSVADSANVFEWSSAALINNTGGNTPGLVIDGGTGNGLNVLEIESATAQNLDFSATLTSGTNIKNVEVFDLTDGPNSGNANNIKLSADDVFTLAQNEPTAIKNAGGAVAFWILGNGNDTVNLTGTGSTWTQISPQVTTVGQAPGGSPSQMVGFTEYSAQTSGAQTVHVYVQNAIQAAGHVTHA